MATCIERCDELNSRSFANYLKLERGDKVENMTNETFDQLIDINQVRELLASQHALSGMTYAILDTDENPLIAVGWQDICVRLHRVNPVSRARCRESDAFIKAHLHDMEGDCLEYRCKNGMMDVALPIVIDGRHLATFFTGQFFYDDDRPDTENFLMRAEALGFDHEVYLNALERVPVFSREHVRSTMLFLRDMVKILAEIGLKNLRLACEAEERKRAEAALRIKQQQLTAMTIELSLAEERERRRIASELHDHIGQNLLLAKFKLGAQAGPFVSNSQEKALTEIGDILVQSIRDIRSLAQQLSPPILAGAGMEAALEWLVKQMEDNYSLQVSFADDQNPKPLAEEIRSVVFQAARELLINVSKHAETDSARLVIGRERNMFRLIVEDRGCGFDPSGGAADRYRDNVFGLFNIRERITYLGGDVSLESKSGRGTRVTLRVPLDL